MTTPYATQVTSPANGQTPAAVTVEQHPLPPPNTFDFLPPLHALLSRILSPSGASLLSQPQGGIGDLGVPGTSELNASITGDSIAGAGSTEATQQSEGDLAGGARSDDHLDIQQLGTAASGIKVRIQKARAAVQEFPDVERSLEEQEEEIRMLEDKIEKMRGILGAVGGREGNGDVVMGDG